MKLTPSMKKRFDETVNGFIEQGVIPSYEDAVAKLDEVAQSPLAKKLLEKFKTLDNEFVQNFLIDYFRDEVGRGLLNPVIPMRMKITSVRTFDAKEFGDDRKPTGKTIKTTKAFGSVCFKNKAGKWESPKPGQLTAVEKFSDVVDGVLADGKTFVLDVTCPRPDVKGLINATFGERCTNVKEDENDDMPLLEEILLESFDKMPIHDAESQRSKDKFELKLIEGTVVNHPLMPGAGNKRFSANFQMSDSSVTTEDLAAKGKKAYLNVQCAPEMVSFGKDSIIMMLGVVQWNPDDFLGPAFVKNPPVIVPIVRFDLPQTDVTATSSSGPVAPQRPQKAADIIKSVTQMRAPSVLDKVAKKEEPKHDADAEGTEAAVEEKKPKRKVISSEEEKFLEECQGFGRHDASDAGCKACAKEYEKKGKPEHHIYPACIEKSK